MVATMGPRQALTQSAPAYKQGASAVPNRKKRKGIKMSSTKIIALVLIIAGVLGLAYGKFTYTKETHDAKVGPIELSVKDKETVNIPMWAGIGAIVVGAGLLLAGGRKI
jgi:hypothetical protein